MEGSGRLILWRASHIRACDMVEPPIQPMVRDSMKDRIAAFWQGLMSPEANQRSGPQDDPKLAAAVLMVEVARMDDTIDAEERDRIRELVKWKFDLTEAEAGSLVAEAETITAGPAHWHRFAAALRDSMEPPERLQIVDLLNVTDADSGAARLRTRKRYGIHEDSDPVGT